MLNNNHKGKKNLSYSINTTTRFNFGNILDLKEDCFCNCIIVPRCIIVTVTF